jgi:3',5'-cyclic AMP phosphodiesterase CpdA
MRIAYLTDSHRGADNGGFHQQPFWVDGLDELVDRLRQWIARQHIDLLIHGGDLVEHPDLPVMGEALGQFVDLGLPLLVCLGNHDIAVPGAFEQWQQIAAEMPSVTLADGVVAGEGCDIIALNNHWDDGAGPQMYWDPTPPFRFCPTLADEQLQWLDTQLGRDDRRPAILVVHTQIDPVPPTAPQLDEYIPPSYPEKLNAVLDRHPRCRLVLSGHCHVTSAIPRPMRVHLTTASFGEVPFHVRLIDVSSTELSIETHSMGPAPQDVQFDETRAWSAGSTVDQQLVVPAR